MSLTAAEVPQPLVLSAVVYDHVLPSDDVAILPFAPPITATVPFQAPTATAEVPQPVLDSAVLVE